MNSFTRALAGATVSLLFVARYAAAALAADSPGSGGTELAPSPEPAGKAPGILVNHVGFAPQAAKCCLIPGATPVAFEVIDTATGRAAFTGRTTIEGPDLGSWQAGDFSALDRTGAFQVRAGNGRSGTFVIAPDPYEDALRKTVAYFSKQRCGPSETGYHAPCHLDDGRRRDNGQHQDVTGGWHDACDLRKWVDATIFGMIGLARVAELRRPEWGRASIPAELRWGNRYFLAMQEPAGYVMNYCGGDDGNRWTSNTVGDQDERPIHTEPCNATAQFCFIIAQAAAVRLAQEAGPVYAAKCREAGLRGLAWCRKTNAGRTSTDLGAAVAACVELHRTFGDDQYRTLAIEYARRLVALQVTERTDGAGGVRGFFRTSPDDGEPRRDISHGCWQLIGLCMALERFPTDADAPGWRRAIRLYVDDFLAPLMARNAFAIAPFGLYSKDPGGSRRAGDYWYRYFMEPGPRWWVGINANLASTGVGLAKAARLLKEPRLAALAQRQLDWILGVNPFDASTMTGVGRNQPTQFVTSEFKPVTPLIDGAVMNGIGGTPDDEPDLKPGSWQTCEYWTPMVCYTMWLMSELSARPPD
jgi:hypothetical protein